MGNAYENIASFLVQRTSGEYDAHPFWHFEPWDVEKREEWVLQQALRDGVDLRNDDFTRHDCIDPHPFQSGYLLSTDKFRTLMAGSRVGKSYPVIMELAIMASGQKPIALQHPRGFNTGVRRIVSKENIRRFGRFDCHSGAYIDHNENAKMPKSWKEWDCGCIHGVGIYPDENIAPENSILWVGTTNRALMELWWPTLTHFTSGGLIPPDFVDKRSGIDGVMKSEWTIYFLRGVRVAIISYESGYRKFESVDTWACPFDEESPDQRCVTAAINHTKYFSLVETPYMGITYTKDMVFPKERKEGQSVYHATAYDSPYLTRETIEHRRNHMPEYEIVSRMWGSRARPVASPTMIG